MSGSVAGANRVLLRYTYELYFHTPQGERTFEPLTCFERDLADEVHRVHRARGAPYVEVHRFGRHLFSLGDKPGS